MTHCPAKTIASSFPKCTTATNARNLLTAATPDSVWAQLRTVGHVTSLPEGALRAGDVVLVVSGDRLLCRVGNTGPLLEVMGTLQPTAVPDTELLVHASLVPTNKPDGTVRNVLLLDRVLATSAGPFVGNAAGNHAILTSIKLLPDALMPPAAAPEIAVAWRGRSDAAKALWEFANPADPTKREMPHSVVGLRFDLPYAVCDGVSGDWLWLDGGVGGCLTAAELFAKLA